MSSRDSDDDDDDAMPSNDEGDIAMNFQWDLQNCSQGSFPE